MQFREKFQVFQSPSIRSLVCPVGALIYESDRYVPTGEPKQGSLGVGFRSKRRVIGCGIQLEIGPF